MRVTAFVIQTRWNRGGVHGSPERDKATFTLNVAWPSGLTAAGARGRYRTSVRRAWRDVGVALTELLRRVS